LDPSGIFFEEQSGAFWVERGPHEGVMAEAKNEEIAGGKGLEDVEGDCDFGEGLLRDDSCCGVVEDGQELGRSGGGGV